MPKLTRKSALVIILAVIVCPQPQKLVAQAQHRAGGQNGASLSGLARPLFTAKTFSQAVISPNGKQVAWVEAAPSGGSSIFVSEVSGSQPRAITAASGPGHFAEDSVAWSPDSKSLAFLSDAAKSGQQQLYVLSLSGGQARKLTSVKGFLSTPGFSPDGKTVGVLFTENATRAAGPLVAETPQTGVIQDSVTEQRLALVDVTAGGLDR